jgi:hypothetical protein
MQAKSSKNIEMPEKNPRSLKEKRYFISQIPNI